MKELCFLLGNEVCLNLPGLWSLWKGSWTIMCKRKMKPCFLVCLYVSLQVEELALVVLKAWELLETDSYFRSMGSKVQCKLPDEQGGTLNDRHLQP